MVELDRGWLLRFSKPRFFGEMEKFIDTPKINSFGYKHARKISNLFVFVEQLNWKEGALLKPCIHGRVLKQ